MKANNLSIPENQGVLPISRPSTLEIPIEFIRSKKTGAAAFTLACDTCGLDDKEIYFPLGIDPGYFSKMKHGDATLQSDLLSKFCNHIGNRIYAEWLAYQIGCTLVEIESETQRQLRSEREKRAEAEKENDLLRKLLVGRAV